MERTTKCTKGRVPQSESAACALVPGFCVLFTIRICAICPRDRRDAHLTSSRKVAGAQRTNYTGFSALLRLCVSLFFLVAQTRAICCAVWSCLPSHPNPKSKIQIPTPCVCDPDLDTRREVVALLELRSTPRQTGPEGRRQVMRCCVQVPRAPIPLGPVLANDGIIRAIGGVGARPMPLEGSIDRAKGPFPPRLFGA
jgi:hypothetical protein